MRQLVAALTATGLTMPAPEVIQLPENGEATLTVYHQPGPGPAILYVHGSTFPAELSISYRLGGKSWADDLQSRGFDVWSFDFAGYGGSGRPSAMLATSLAREEVPGRAKDASHQIERVAEYIRGHSHNHKFSIIAHSWGTIPAAIVAGNRPEWIDRLVLFGPVAQREGRDTFESMAAPSRLVSTADQWRSFQSGVPADESSPIARGDFEPWAKAYLQTDDTSDSRTPASVRVPAGPDIDFNYAWNGRLPYDPALVRASTLIVRGEWDAITRDADAAWLVAALRNVPGGERDLKLPGGAHRMHLEANRQLLFDAVGKFLAEDRK